MEKVECVHGPNGMHDAMKTSKFGQFKYFMLYFLAITFELIHASHNSRNDVETVWRSQIAQTHLHWHGRTIALRFGIGQNNTHKFWKQCKPLAHWIVWGFASRVERRLFTQATTLPKHISSLIFVIVHNFHIQDIFPHRQQRDDGDGDEDNDNLCELGEAANLIAKFNNA